MTTALFYLLDGASNASSRHRVLQYFPYFREHGIQPHASLPVPEALYQRLIERGGSQRQKAMFYATFLARRLRDVLNAKRFDVVVIQRDLFPFGPPVLERQLMQANPRLVYDTDDATYLRPSFTPDTPFQRLRRFDKVREVVRNARWVSAATEPIAAWAREYNADVSVVPMALDLRQYDSVRRPKKQADTTVLGWAGTAGGLRYLHDLAPLLRELSAKHRITVRVISGGYRDVCLPGVPVEASSWRPERSLQDIAGFDIGLVPLAASPFEQAKFPFKLLQYLALGVPAVSARVGVASTVLRHGENGFLATTPEDWREALELLLEDASLRRKLADAGRATVEAGYTIERVAPLLVHGLNRAAA